jgi:hypothetical protein
MLGPAKANRLPQPFAFVHVRVGFRDQQVKRAAGTRRMVRQPDTEREHVRLLLPVKLPDGLFETLDHFGSGVLVGANKHQSKLISAQSCRDVGLTTDIQQETSGRDQCAIAFLVPVAIVDVFEAVEVRKHK